MSTKPVLVIGATGTVGREVVKTLRERGERVRALVREPSGAARNLPGVELHPGTLDDAASLEAAMRGCRAAFFVTAHGPSEERHGMQVIAAAEAQGLERLVYSAAWRLWSPNRWADALLVRLQGWLGPQYRAKLRVSRRLMASNVSHVLLWPTNFFQNDVLVRRHLAAGSYLQALGHQPVNRVDVRDIALAAARAVTAGLVPDGAWPVVGPRALTGLDCAALWSRALGRPIAYDPDVERWSEAVRDALTPEARHDWSRTFRLIRRFGVRPHPRDLELTTRLLGRAPRSYEAWTFEQAAGLAAASARDAA